MKRKGTKKESGVTAACKGLTQEEAFVMEPGIEQTERKKENQEKRFLLGIGLKFCLHLGGICL